MKKETGIRAVWASVPVFLIVSMLALPLYRCGKGDRGTTTTAADSADASSPVKARVEKRGYQASTPIKTLTDGQAHRLIESISFSPEIPRADSTLKVNLETSLEEGELLDEDEYFYYIFWKNGEKLTEKRENSLPPFSYAKGDFIFVDVLFYRDEKVVERERSPMIQVLNSAPVIKQIVIPEIKGFGTYSIMVKTEDINNDKLVYRIEGENVPSALEIDPATGTVTYNMDAAPPNEIKFMITADDGDGGVAKKEVSLRFTRAGQSPEKEKEEKEE